MSESNDSEENNSGEISLSINKKNLMYLGVVALFFVASGAAYYSYELSNEVDSLESDLQEMERVNTTKSETISNLTSQVRTLEENTSRLQSLNENKSQRISSLESRTVEAKYEENKEQIRQDIREIASAGSFQGYLEVKNMELKNNMVYADVEMVSDGQTQVQSVYVTLEGELLFLVREQMDQVLSPINIEQTLAQIDEQETSAIT